MPITKKSPPKMKATNNLKPKKLANPLATHPATIKSTTPSQHQSDKPTPAFKVMRLLKRPTFTVADLLRKALADRRESSKGCAVQSVRTGLPPVNHKDWKHFIIRVKTKDNKHLHVTQVFFAGEVAPETPVVIGCDCADYTYTFSYVHAKKGSGFQYNATDEPPVQRNPRMLQGAGCKHTYLALRYLHREKLKANKEV
jgi:hypothetical protein